MIPFFGFPFHRRPMYNSESAYHAPDKAQQDMHTLPPTQSSNENNTYEQEESNHSSDDVRSIDIFGLHHLNYAPFRAFSPDFDRL